MGWEGVVAASRLNDRLSLVFQSHCGLRIAEAVRTLKAIRFYSVDLSESWLLNGIVILRFLMINNNDNYYLLLFFFCLSDFMSLSVLFLRFVSLPITQNRVYRTV